ncbi:MAG: helix-turn-helix transcriptional regulator [Caenispirillum bisanense]|nr:helix-turn-helix transcriptional regulator [Caenispirillum bisanense]MCA1974032.1 helix-turn-helix transcriptional regulator [Caenispirillum sp.]
MARARHRRMDCSPGCVVEGTLDLIEGKWKGLVLYHLMDSGTLRFNELRRRLPNCTQRMLTTQLRELEEDGLLARRVYAEVPPKVEYSLTPRGESLRPVIAALKAWGDANVVLAPAAAAEAGGDGAEAAE